ncbi:MAG: hypothetical protein ABI047_15060 [Jatrophihabitantaceae bacterium]
MMRTWSGQAEAGELLAVLLVGAWLLLLEVLLVALADPVDVAVAVVLAVAALLSEDPLEPDAVGAAPACWVPAASRSAVPSTATERRTAGK